MGRAPQADATPGWRPREGSWSWDVPGQSDPLHLVQEPLRQVQHRVRDSLRCHASHHLEARRPVTFGGMGYGADGPACRAAMRLASTELEWSLLRGLLTRALWTAARVRGHRMRDNSECPHRGAAHEDEEHVLWGCPEWETARATWLPWLQDAAGDLPQLGPPDQWPAFLRRLGLMPLWLARGAELARLDEFLHCLHGMYLAVLEACMAAGRGNPDGPGDALFPAAPQPRPRQASPWGDLICLLPREAQRERPQSRLGTPQGWRWPPRAADEPPAACGPGTPATPAPPKPHSPGPARPKTPPSPGYQASDCAERSISCTNSCGTTRPPPPPLPGWGGAVRPARTPPRPRRRQRRHNPNPTPHQGATTRAHWGSSPIDAARRVWLHFSGPCPQRPTAGRPYPARAGNRSSSSARAPRAPTISLPAPRAASVDATGGLPEPSAPANRQLPQKQHGRASTEET